MKTSVIITTENGERLYTRQEVQKMLQVEETTIHRYIKNEVLIPTRTDIKILLFQMGTIKQCALITGRANKLLKYITL